MAGRTIGAAEFKTHCLRIFDEVDRSGETVTVTKRGRPVAEVRPVAKKERGSIIGCLKIPGYSFPDPVSPAYEGLWDAEREGPWGPGA